MIWLWVKNRYPKWHPCKRKHGLKNAVPWFHFDLQPFEGVIPILIPLSQQDTVDCMSRCQVLSQSERPYGGPPLKGRRGDARNQAPAGTLSNDFLPINKPSLNTTPPPPQPTPRIANTSFELPNIYSVVQSRPFDLLVFPCWSIFSRGPKRLTFYKQVLWATEFSN